MRCVYNGVDLYFIELHEFGAESVYDNSGVDYLYTKYLFSGRAIINGQVEVYQGWYDLEGVWHCNGPAVTYRLDFNRTNPSFNNVPNGGQPSFTTGFNNQGFVERQSVPYFGPGNQFYQVGGPSSPGLGGSTGTGQTFGQLTSETGTDQPISQLLYTLVPQPVSTGTTHQAIRHRLTTPRGQLFVFASGTPAVSTPNSTAGPVQMFLASPSPGTVVDCNNGPKPRVFNIIQAFGDATTLMADIAIETYVNEAADNGVDPNFLSAILSNRFSQVHHVDERGYTTVATSGEMICRTDQLYKFGANPDSFRGRIFMPIPNGFVRENILVAGLPDVTGVSYEYVDRQVPVNFPAGLPVRAASISAVHRQAIVNNNSVFEGALSAYERTLGIAANRNFARGDAHKPLVPGGANAGRRTIPAGTPGGSAIGRPPAPSGGSGGGAIGPKPPVP